MSPPPISTFFRPLPLVSLLCSKILLITLFFLSFGSPVESQFTSGQNFLPFSYPLAVRSPYLNTWQNTQINTTSLTHDWPRHWSGPINGWSGLVRIDGVTWKWLGNPPTGNATTIQSSQVTPTRSIFTLSAGVMTLTITFFSPIETGDLTRQSIPFSYVSFECQSRDGAAHDVQVYSDISAEWISGDRTNLANWTTTLSSSSVIHSASRQAPQSMRESSNIAEDATVYYAMAQRDGMTYQSGQDIVVRGQFDSQGKLTDGSDSTFRAIQDDFVVFGISVDLGSISSTSKPVVWGLGLFRDPITTYSNTSSSRRPYFFSDPRFAGKTVQDVIDFSLQDYDSAVSRADALDARIEGDTKAASPGSEEQYFNLVAMAARVAVGAVDVTFEVEQEGGVNRTDVKAFMRNTGFDQSANNVPTLYSNFPALLYLNASWGGYLLDSLLEYQSSSVYNNPYAAPSLGSTYPLTMGDNGDTSSSSVEDTASMLIMVLAHARTSGDGSLIEKYYNLLKKWADYLVANAVHPKNQVSSDNTGTSVSDSSKIAMKAIIGVGAMAQISRAFGSSADESSYQANATTFAVQWKSLALSSQSIMATYGDTGSFALMYDLYADMLLGTGLFDQDVYNAQNAMVQTQGQSPSAGSFGIPIDSQSSTITRSSRLMFVAGSLSKTSNSTRNQLINDVFARAAFNQSNNAGGNFPVVYDTQSGQMSNSPGQASPAQGAVFALLTLNMPNQTITLSSTSPPSSSKVNVGAIVGGVIGGLAGLALLLIGVLLFKRWRRRRADQQRMFKEPRSSQRLSMMGVPNVLTPFFGNANAPASEGGSYNPYNNFSQVDQTQGSRILQAGDGYGAGAVAGPSAGYGNAFAAAGHTESGSGGGGASDSTGSSEKRRGAFSNFAPNRGTNWDGNASNQLSDGTDATSPTVSSRYPQSSRSDMTSQLRQEVEGLRLEMQELRAQARDYEPPPSYQ